MRRRPNKLPGGVSVMGNLLFDFDAAMVRLDGNRELFVELIRFFDEDAPELIERIRTGLGTQDAVGVERAAHTLKGLAANFGARQAVEAAETLEIAARGGSLDDARDALPRLEDQFDQLRRALLDFSSQVFP